MRIVTVASVTGLGLVALCGVVHAQKQGGAAFQFENGMPLLDPGNGYICIQLADDGSGTSGSETLSIAGIPGTAWQVELASGPDSDAMFAGQPAVARVGGVFPQDGLVNVFFLARDVRRLDGAAAVTISVAGGEVIQSEIFIFAIEPEVTIAAAVKSTFLGNAKTTGSDEPAPPRPAEAGRFDFAAPTRPVGTVDATSSKAGEDSLIRARVVNTFGLTLRVTQADARETLRDRKNRVEFGAEEEINSLSIDFSELRLGLTREGHLKFAGELTHDMEGWGTQFNAGFQFPRPLGGAIRVASPSLNLKDARLAATAPNPSTTNQKKGVVDTFLVIELPIERSLHFEQTAIYEAKVRLDKDPGQGDLEATAPDPHVEGVGRA